MLTFTWWDPGSYGSVFVIFQLTKLVIGLCKDDGELQLEVETVAVCSNKECL